MENVEKLSTSELSNERSVIVRSEQSIIMPPPVGRPSKAKAPAKVVLDEETYVKSIESIIERDFFPQLGRLKRKLDAEVESSAIEVSNTNLSGFFAKYTSEDNSSFEEIHEEDLDQHRRQYHWAYDSADHPSDKMRLYFMDNKVLTLEEREKFDMILDKKSSTMLTQSSGAPIMWRHDTRNSFMFPVEYDQASSDQKLLTDVDGIKKREKQIVYENTNFQSEDVSNNRVLLERSPSVSGSWDSESTISKDNILGRHYGFVEMTPSPDAALEKSPMMTWGKIDGTPMILPISSSPASNNNKQASANIPVRSRDELARSLDHLASIRGRSINNSVLNTPLSTISHSSKSSSVSRASSRSMLAKQQSLSQAGKKLASRLFSNKTDEPFGGQMKSQK